LNRRSAPLPEGVREEYDAVVIGSGPNGLAGAIRLAQEGWSVLVIEGHGQPGGGARTAELTRPGFHHDVCSAVYPMALASPFFQSLPLEEHGLEWIHPEAPLAHPFDDGTAAAMYRSVAETAAQFRRESADGYHRLFDPLLEDFDDLIGDLLAPPKLPRHPVAVGRFGFRVIPSALEFSRAWFSDERARALVAGNAAHSVVPLDRVFATNAIGLMLMMAGHAYGWPVAKGGSGRVVDALVSYLESLGGQVACDWRVESIEELPRARAYLFDTSPSALSSIAATRLPDRFRSRLERFRHGPGIFKIDYALDEPAPWTAEVCRRAGTVHVGGLLDEIAESERAAWEGRLHERPFVLTAQQSLFDDTRAPHGQHTFWAYCHVPAGSTVDRTEAIENQIERFAPGFRECVLARHTMNCSDLESYNPNLIGGDIVGGVTDWRQLFTRPVARLKPHTTPAKDIYICSASTPPGAGVHGVGGYWAAQAALKRAAAGAH